MSKGFKLLLVADEDPEFRTYIRNIVKERIGNVEDGVLVEVLKQSITESTGKFAERIDEQIKSEVKRFVQTTTGSGGYSWKDAENLKEYKAFLNQCIAQTVKDIVTPDMVREILEKILREKFSEISQLSLLMSQGTSVKPSRKKKEPL